MKAFPPVVIVIACLLVAPSGAEARLLPVAIESGRDDGGEPEVWLEWEAEPGLRHGVYRSHDLRHWSLVPGFPQEANDAGGEYASALWTNRLFFQVAELGPDPAGFSWIPDGVYRRGDAREYAEHYMESSRPAREVSVSGFFLARAPVTYGEWREVYAWAVDHGYAFDGPGEAGWRARVGPLPDGPQADRHPVVAVTWHDAVKWCNARSEREGRKPAYYADEARQTVYRTGRAELSENHVDWDADGYRLPTEAEWEKAARGGLEAELWPWGAAGLDGVRANFAGAGLDRGTTAVGDYPANAYDLYDLVGNVWEWCWDRYAADWYADDASVQPDPRGPAATGESDSILYDNPRILRGGSWQNVPGFSYVSMRHWAGEDQDSHARNWGFRVVRGGNP